MVAGDMNPEMSECHDDTSDCVLASGGRRRDGTHCEERDGPTVGRKTIDPKWFGVQGVAKLNLRGCENESHVGFKDNKVCRLAGFSRWRDLSVSTAPAKCGAVWAD